jgi:hypothetical protein
VRWIPFQLSDGWYCLPSFRYLGLTGRDWKQAENGLHYAAPEMLALANLLAHPKVGTKKMSGQIGNRTCCDPRRISGACSRSHGSRAAAARRRGSRAGKRRFGEVSRRVRRVEPLRGKRASRAARGRARTRSSASRRGRRAARRQGRHDGEPSRDGSAAPGRCAPTAGRAPRRSGGVVSTSGPVREALTHQPPPPLPVMQLGAYHDDVWSVQKLG